MPRPARWYQGGLPVPAAGSLRALRATPLSPQISRSLVFVPELSPRETKCARPAAPAAAIASSAPTASWRAACSTPAGSLAGPTMTKSFHITVRPTGSSEKPSATNWRSSAGEWPMSTSPWPARAFVIACPVPTATNLRSYCGKRRSNCGVMSWSSTPESRTLVVLCTIRSRLACAPAVPAAMSSTAAASATVLTPRRAPPILISSVPFLRSGSPPRISVSLAVG